MHLARGCGTACQTVFLVVHRLRTRPADHTQTTSVVVRGGPHRTAAVIAGRVTRSSAAASPSPPEPSMRWPVDAATGTRARAHRRTGAQEQLPRRRGSSRDAVASAATSALSRSLAGAHPTTADSPLSQCSMNLLITMSTTDQGGAPFGATPRRPTRSPPTARSPSRRASAPHLACG